MLLDQRRTTTPQTLMLQASLGPILSKALSLVTRLNIADLLAEHAKTSDELAQMTGTHAQFLDRILRFLVALDIFDQDSEGRFVLTPLSATLRSDAPDSPRDWITFNTESWRWDLVQALDETIFTGQSSYEQRYQKSVYEVFSENAAYGTAFNRAMSAWSASLPAAVLDAYDFSRSNKIIDMGAGIGKLIAAILEAYSTLQGVLFDQPHVVQESANYIRDRGMNDRCECIGGNFLTAVPSGGDLYLFSTVLMDWVDEDCITILKHCQQAMQPGGKVLILEPIADQRDSTPLGQFVDMIMLLETSGRIRSQPEWQRILKAAGFSINRVVPTHTIAIQIIEAVRCNSSGDCE